MIDLPTFWKRWGAIVVAGFTAASVAFGGVYYLGGRVIEIDAAKDDIAEIQQSLKTFQTRRLPGLERQVSHLENQLLALDQDPTLEEALGHLRTSTSDLQRDVARVGERYQILLERDEEHSAMHSEMRQETAKELKEIRSDISDISIKTERLDAVFELLKPVFKEGLAMGRISAGELRKVYTETEVAQLVKDVIEVIEKGPDASPESRGGGHGGYGSSGTVRVAGGTMNVYGDCQGPPHDCLYTSWLVPSSDGSVLQEIRIELRLNLQSDQLALLQDTTTRVKLLASARESGESLCKWTFLHLRGSMAS